MAYSEFSIDLSFHFILLGQKWPVSEELNSFDLLRKCFIKDSVSQVLTDLALGSDFKTLRNHTMAFEARFPVFCFCRAQSSIVYSGNWSGSLPHLFVVDH